ncbi:aminotransferase class I/II-fold pyridoxal phosphate-dependent enzyme [Ruegeria sp. 2012CJ41-6]|uniref:Aminotransferase class I/II-fold pyridoxal phosphate-dependent enzyme n=1 Tax=Ruegeria spongiae TaxID=2942209 RepID=A0ABT0Q777_9RHOB|nr:histidinol-phosphate transaminase [Ruegeria spongiae]MCL6285417.1 aminotransferase class I/II-fold pyridoxal phosphate-dependent enzyme [Ruegeria spongiae]
MTIARAKTGIERIKPHMMAGADMSAPPPAILLNSNESAFGPSPAARQAARAAVSAIERYLESPDRLLAPAIAAHHGLDAARITTGQGSDDLLARLARAYLGPDTELIRSANGYLKVPNYAYANDAEVVSVPDDRFKPSVDRMIAALSARTRMVYLANPENPAGTYLSGGEIRRLHAALPENVLLVVDAAYEEYVDAEDYEPAHMLVEEADNVVMCRTFSKAYGLAGARLGWVYGPEDVVDTLRRIGVTFPVSSPSVAAALAALEDTAHMRLVQEANRSGRNWISSQMRAQGLGVVPSQGNFVLVHFPDPEKSAEAADRWLRQAGIAVRRFASEAYRDHIRITIGHPQDLKAARDGIAEFLNGGV